MNGEQVNSNLLKFLRENWMLLMFVIGIIFSWANFNTKVSQQEIIVSRNQFIMDTELNKIKTRQEIDMQSLNNLRQDIVEIKTTLLFIKEKVSQ